MYIIPIKKMNLIFTPLCSFIYKNFNNPKIYLSLKIIRYNINTNKT